MSALDAWYGHTLRGFSALIASALNNEDGVVVDAEHFVALVRAAIDSYGVVTSEDFEQEFDVSASTVTRWRTGHSAPYKPLRPIVLEWLKGKVDEKAGTRALSRLEAKTFDAAIFDGAQLKLA